MATKGKSAGAATVEADQRADRLLSSSHELYRALRRLANQTAGPGSISWDQAVSEARALLARIDGRR